MAPLIFMALALPASASAADKLPDCIHVSSTNAKSAYQPSLDDVRDCQDRVRQKLIDDAAAKGKPLSDKRIERIDDLQRAEVKDYLEKSGVVIDGKSKNDRSLGGNTAENLSRVTADESAELQGLEKRLHDAAGDGKDGITPQMGRDILDALMKKQGYVSPDMKDLLDSVVRDGGKLKADTMKKLQNAGREAKGQGLDLNIDKKTEKDLLEHDFDSDKDAPPPPAGDPGNL